MPLAISSMVEATSSTVAADALPARRQILDPGGGLGGRGHQLLAAAARSAALLLTALTDRATSSEAPAVLSAEPARCSVSLRTPSIDAVSSCRVAAVLSSP